MRFLGLSSATDIISLGLIDDDRLLVEATLADLRSEKIVFYLEEAGIKPDQMAGVAVTTGPGSYSGLRGGLATAKTLAQTLSIPLVGVSTLETIAYNLVNLTGTLAVFMSTRLDEYCTALFVVRGGRLERLTADFILTESKLAAKLGQVSGDIHLVGRSCLLREKLTGDNYHWAEEVQGQPYGVNVARLGLLKYQTGKVDDPLQLVPHYSHLPNIREYKR